MKSLQLMLMVLLAAGCAAPSRNVHEIIDRPVEEVDHYHQCRKVRKNGMTVVYLTGTPYEIGFAHGWLCRDEIVRCNRYCWDAYEKLASAPDGQWLPLSRSLEAFIPEEYRLEMKGIADGSGLSYDKILFLNTLVTISEHNKCFAFSIREEGERLWTLRQIDISPRITLWKKMVLYIVKPLEGYGFAALLNPGWVSGETGMNEKGLTVSENNIHIRQTEWEVMPVDALSRRLLQYAGSAEEAEGLLKAQTDYPARLLFISNPEGASIFEIANREMARIDMDGPYLAVANHAVKIPSRNITAFSLRRLEFAEHFLKRHQHALTVEKAIELVRTSRITWFWNPAVHNRQSVVFSPSTLDFWVALPPDSDSTPASRNPYVGFNLKRELYGTGSEPTPKSFPSGRSAKSTSKR